MWLSRAALALGILAVLLLLVSGPGVRVGLWPWQTGFLLLRAAVFVGAGAMLLSLIAFSIPRARSMMLLGALALGVAAAAVPLEFQRRARAFPPINDISTAGDTAPAMAEQQRRAYPDVRPLTLPVPPEEAFAKARLAALDMGWDIVSADPAGGRIEAEATTPWFGFRDDVTVRVSREGAASRIDVRSRSRVGRGDAGANAGRIRRYLKMLRA
jgi:uncharacterized protein (DUF1499 family)